MKVDEYSVKMRNFSGDRAPRGFFSVPDKVKTGKSGRVFFQRLNREAVAANG